MKKIWITLFLALSLCMMEVPIPAFAAECETEVREEEQLGFVDLSDEIVQEGGYLSRESTNEEQIALFSASEDERLELAKDALTAAWDFLEDTCDLSTYQVTAAELEEIYYELLNAYPRYFYVGGGYSYYYNQSTGCVTEVMIKYKYNESEAKSMLTAYDKAVLSAVSGAERSWSDMEKALYINDYIARNCEYDTSYSKYSAYDVLVGKKAVCQGYALAFKALAQELGVSCELVTSTSLNHAWNLVAVNDAYYHVDVTWNDPVGDKLGRARHQYFAKSTDYFKSETGGHLKQNDWNIGGGWSDTYAADTTYDDYFWNSVDTGFEYLNGDWYGFDGTNSINRYVCNGTDFSYECDIVAVEDVWYVLGNTSSYWAGKYVGTGSFQGNLYYSGNDSIYRLDVAAGTSTPIFTLPEEQKQSGYIYGMNITSLGEVCYLLAESPNEQGTAYVAERLTCVEHKNTEVRNKTDATCKEEGYTGDTYCKDCGVLLAKGQSISKQPHTVITDLAVEAGCTTAGKTQGSHCSVCGTVIVEQEDIPATGHSWDTKYTVDREATVTAPGQESIHCRKCEATKDIREIPKKNKEENKEDIQISITKAIVALSKKSYYYDGKAKNAVVKSVKLNVGSSTKTLKKNIDYTISYKNNTNIGTATVTITGKGNYTGTVKRTFKIIEKKGTIFTVGDNKYKITSSSEVAFAGLKSKRTTKVTIPKTVKYGGKNFKVTAVADKALYKKTKVTSVTIDSNVKTIGKEAFRGCSKLSNITINSTKLKSVGKNALKGIKSTAKIRVPSEKLTAYKTLLKGKGQSSKVKITK